MPSIFVTANDTGVGKTWVTATLARLLLAGGHCVEVVKAIETGVLDGEAGDAAFVRQELAHSERLSTRTLHTFSQPLAPVEAARLDGEVLSFDDLLAELRALPEVPWRIIEGAGGVAVPLEEGACPRDFGGLAMALAVDYVVLVVEDRLGAINQARLLAEYARQRDLNAGWWLNAASADVPAAIRLCNRQTLECLDFPLWACQDYQAAVPMMLPQRNQARLFEENLGWPPGPLR